jgi:hypothetical protein
MNTINFTKECSVLVACALGIAVVGIAAIGYLGYHAVRWIIAKCSKTEKVDQAAQKVFKPQIPINSIDPVLEELKKRPEQIKMGHGEYVVFKNSPEGEKEALSRDTFEKAYQVLDQYSPAAIVNNNSDKNAAAEQCANRYELIRTKIKEIDPSLEIAFIPRSLYELIFVRKCIKEDLKAKEVCPLLEPYVQSHLHYPDEYANSPLGKEITKQMEAEKVKRKCWHLCYFNDAGDNQQGSVKDVAYRLNRVITKALLPQKGGFTYKELTEFTEKEIDFLKAHHTKYPEYLEQIKTDKAHAIKNLDKSSPTTSFGVTTTWGSINSMSIRDDKDAQILRNAMALECSKVAQKSFLLYRGADFQSDSPISRNNANEPFSLSYGTGPLAGVLYDGGATAWHFMRNEQNAYVIPLPFEKLNDSPFYIPPSNAVSQLFGKGEIFHGRTKVQKGYENPTVQGVQFDRRTGHLKSNLTKEELVAQFQECKKAAIQLK